MAGEKVTPMVANPGRILLTSHRLYFQPFNNAEVVSALDLIGDGLLDWGIVLTRPGKLLLIAVVSYWSLPWVYQLLQ